MNQQIWSKVSKYITTTTYFKKRCQYFDDAKMKTLSRNWVVTTRPQVIFFSSSLDQKVLVHWIEPNTQFRRGVIGNQPTPYSISIIMKKYQCIVKRLDCKPICKKVYLVIYLLYKKKCCKSYKIMTVYDINKNYMKKFLQKKSYIYDWSRCFLSFQEMIIEM